MKSVNQIGIITDSKNTTLLKMWEVTVSSGKLTFTKHQHLNFEIMMVNSGSGIYATESSNYNMQTGDVFVFCSNEWHCITEVGSEGLTITNLQFNPTFIRNSQLSPNFCFYHNPLFHNRIEAKNAVPITKLFRSIQEELRLQETNYMLSAKSYLYLLLVKLTRSHNYSDNTNRISKDQYAHITRVLSYIDLHFTEKITLQALSELAGLTPNYLCALFKQASGMSVWDYISAKRIDKAMQLLTADTHTTNILDIATKSGYNNTANFNKTFKKITGMTPKEYKTNRHIMIS